MSDKKRIAIVGAGISGLTCAYLLDSAFEVTLFEQNDYFGGHTNTKEVQLQDQTVNIDTGFIVYNERNYPLFTRLLKALNVATQKSEMSFSYHSPELEYGGSSLRGLFAQKRNLIRPQFYRLLNNIRCFNRDSQQFLARPDNRSIKAFVDQCGYDDWFWSVYLQPMVSAIWSSTRHHSEDMPAEFILKFYQNHGLLSLKDIPEWRTVKNGSQQYVHALLREFTGNALSSATISSVKPTLSGSVEVTNNGESLLFDEVIFACHSDTALSLLSQPTDEQINVLSGIGYQNNHVVLHTDANVMPKRKQAWSSWNYKASNSGLATLTYYMNRLQSLSSPESVFVTVNTDENIANEHIIAEYQYSHPILNQSAIEAQRQFSTINGSHHCHFCGAYWFNGFHEDGVASAVRVCEQLGVAF